MIQTNPLQPFLLTLFFLCSLIGLSAQSTSSELRILGASYNGKALLRWGPLQYELWIKGVQQGYRLERFTMSNNGTALSDAQVNASKVVLSERLLPASLANFTAMADTNDAAGVAMAAIYNDTIEPLTNTGNELLEALNANEQNDNRFSFALFAADASFVVAQKMALGFVDNSVSPTGVYLYRLSLYSSDTTQVPVRYVHTLDMRIPLALPTMPIPKVETQPQQALISWSRENLDAHYTSYLVERSADNGQSWQQRNDRPLIGLEEADKPNDKNIYFADTILSQSTVYRYRVRGRSPFGIVGAPSTAVSAQSADMPLGGVPVIETIDRLSTGGLRLNWSFPAALNDQIKGFRVYRSTEPDANFQVLGSMQGVGVRTFTHSTPAHTNFYKIKAVDLKDYEHESIAFLGQPIDETPPAKPNGLQGSIDRAGLVKLNWTKNSEADLKGYRIYRSDHENGERFQVTPEPVAANTILDTLNMQTLSRKMYYWVKAVDFRENESAFSNILVLTRPDVNPPSAPVLSALEATDKGVKATWIPSTSSDVLRHVLQRRALGKITWEEILSQNGRPVETQFFVDSTLKDELEWEYRLLAFDSSALFTPSTPQTIKAFQVKMPDIEQFSAESSLIGNQWVVKLSWQYPAAAKIRGFEILRSRAGGPMLPYRVLEISDGDDLSLGQSAGGRKLYAWKDLGADRGVNYQYQVLAKFNNGANSPLSAIVEKKL